MANPHKGEVAFEALGATWTLRYTTDALCQLEDALGRGLVDITLEMSTWGPPADAEGRSRTETPAEAVKRIKGIRLGLVRAMFWAGLRGGGHDIDLAAAGEMMPQVGGMTGVMGLITRAFELSMPQAAPQATGAAPSPPRPPQGRAGRHRTGRAS